MSFKESIFRSRPSRPPAPRVWWSRRGSRASFRDRGSRRGTPRPAPMVVLACEGGRQDLTSPRLSGQARLIKVTRQAESRPILPVAAGDGAPHRTPCAASGVLGTRVAGARTKAGICTRAADSGRVSNTGCVEAERPAREAIECHDAQGVGVCLVTSLFPETTGSIGPAWAIAIVAAGLATLATGFALHWRERRPRNSH